ncbi:A-kinase anchor protein 9-like [Ptychodera flava]|uniref:A-kinase anchor protein 9-like n=1 Tax=Ptychodera flava TaxID=63121 RepID=UPI003969CD22
MADFSAALFLSTSWKKNLIYGPATWQLISDFCENTLKKKPDELSAINCTVLDVELSEEQKEDATRHGVTLIPATRSKWLDPDEDPPAVNWFINHNIYYPELGKFKNVGHVVGLSAKTKNAAAAIHGNLFPHAELHQMPSKPAALFVSNAWSKNELGLTGFHRTLIQDFVERKEKAGEDLKAYSTVLDVKISEEQKEDAENCGVTLIPAQRRLGIKAKDDPPKTEWLLNHESYFPDLGMIEDVQYVVGYAPKTGHAAAYIRAKLFPKAKLVLINHASPESHCLEAEEYGVLEFEEKMLQMASLADLLFSIGPVIYEYFQNAYRAEFHGKELSEIPHEEILPIPLACFRGKDPVLRETSTHGILTCGQVDTQKAIERCETMAASIGTAANYLSESQSNINPPSWKIQGVSQQAGQTLVKFLSGKMQCRHIKPTLHPGHSAQSLHRSLQQSHLCLPAPCYVDYSLYGLEAMVSGLPTATYNHTHLARFITQYLTEHTDNCVVGTEEKNLSKRILKDLQDIPLAFKKAKDLKTDLLQSEVISASCAKFASLLTTNVKQQTGTYQNDHRLKADEKDFPVNVSLDEEMLQKRLTELEKQTQAVSVQLRRLQEMKKNEVKTGWGECEQGLKRRVKAVLADEDSCNEVKKVCKEKVGLDPNTLGTGSLGILLKILTLYYLYRVKQTCRSRNLAKALEPLLITDEMRKIAATVGITLQLKAMYDMAKFEEIELFFINRDGGGVQPVTFYGETEDDGHCNLDSKGEEPPLSQQASDQVVVTASDQVVVTASDQVVVTASEQVVEQISQTKLEQKLEEELIQHDEPTQPITAAQESQARSLLPIKPSKQQLTDSDIRYLALAESKVQSLQTQLDISESIVESLQSQLEKACTEKQIMETQLAEALKEKSQFEKQCQEYMQRCHSAEKVVSTQLSDIHALTDKLEKLDSKNIEKLQIKLKEQDKVITELKTKLSQLSDAQSDIELQKILAESPQPGEQIITSETVHKEVIETSADDGYIETKIAEMEEDERPKPELTGRDRSEMETATPTQPEMTGRDGSEMETATSTQPEMTGRDGSEMETATPTQPEMTVRDGSEMETATPTQPEMTVREGSEMETATSTQPEMTVRMEVRWRQPHQHNLR